MSGTLMTSQKQSPLRNDLVPSRTGWSIPSTTNSIENLSAAEAGSVTRIWLEMTNFKHRFLAQLYIKMVKANMRPQSVL